MKLKDEKYTLGVLDSQYSYILFDAQGLPIRVPENEKQLWYYKGMKDMVDIVVSDGHTTPAGVKLDKDGHHSIVGYGYEG